jgi:hypothetical protein
MHCHASTVRTPRHPPVAAMRRGRHAPTAFTVTRTVQIFSPPVVPHRNAIYLTHSAPLVDATDKSPSQATDRMRRHLPKPPLDMAQTLSVVSFFTAS